MGNEENISPIKRKESMVLSDEDVVKEGKEYPFRRSSVKIRSFHLNKEQYHGQTFGGMKEGYGVYYYQNGDKYDGHWKDNKKESKGYFFYNETGEVYKGNFSNDLPNGIGIYYHYHQKGYTICYKVTHFSNFYPLLV